MNAPVLDGRDLALIEALRGDSRLSEKKLAKRTRIPMTTVHNRLKKLRDSGVIVQYTIRVDSAKLGRPLIAFVMVRASPGADQKKLLKFVASKEGVDEAAMVTGEFDILFRARVASMEELNELVVQELRKSDMVSDTRTMLCYELVEA
ncbi:hypothetical protein AUJ14_00670 [Candidatus Micrarchaeota archaeon CG1_02_55_22]|nr:MAG: hypothetical protein AUJ14_00670 [Candidatus Micrarchaeota archaeon CG1_02_55_22]